MTVEAVLVEGRAAAESLQRDECEITRPVPGEPVFDPGTGEYEDPDDVVVYTGKCRVQSTAVEDPETPEYGGREVSLTDYTVTVPITATAQAGDTVTVTAAADDPELVGLVLTVAAVQFKSQATARRLRCERAT